MQSATSDSSAPTAAPQPITAMDLPISRPFQYNRIVYYTHPWHGFVLETEGFGRSGGARTTIHPFQLKTVFTQEKVDAFRDTYAALGWIPEHISMLLNSGEVERSVGYLLAKGTILSKHYKWSTAKMDKWLKRHLFPAATKGRYLEYDGLLRFDINLHKKTKFHTPRGDHLIVIRTLPPPINGEPDLRQHTGAWPPDTIFMKCPQQFNARLVELSAFCYTTTISPGFQSLRNVEEVRSLLIEQDKAKGETAFGFEECGRNDPDLATLTNKSYQKAYSTANDSIFESIHRGHSRAQENKENKERKDAAAKARELAEQSAKLAPENVGSSTTKAAKRPKVLMDYDEDLEEE